MYPNQKKIPTILALFLLLVGLGSTIYLDRFSHTYFTSASATPIPQDIHFTNNSDSSFTVSWVTAKPTIGSVSVTDRGNTYTLLDDLDSDNTPRPRNTHMVTIKSLIENSSYDVKIISGSACTTDISCPIFTQKTGTKLTTASQLPPMHGTILTQQNKPAETALVYITIGKSSPLSARVDSSGLWVIPLTNLRTQDLTNHPVINDSDLVQITIQYSATETTSAVTDAKSVKQNIKIPVMTIGNTYNFIDTQVKADNGTTSQTVLGTATQNTIIPTGTSKGFPSGHILDILFPKQNNDTTQDKRPRFRGTGIPGKELVITLNSTPQTGRVKVSSDGTWSWRPPLELPPGLHHFSIQGYDSQGKIVTITRPFLVLKSGESVLGDSTPSASLEPSATPTEVPPTATPAPATASPTPVISIQPTMTLTPIPTATLTPAPTAVAELPLPSTAPPRSGADTPTYILLGVSVLLVVVGIKFFFFP
jgi:hypothetical protein